MSKEKTIDTQKIKEVAKMYERELMQWGLSKIANSNPEYTVLDSPNGWRFYIYNDLKTVKVFNITTMHTIKTDWNTMKEHFSSRIVHFIESKYKA